MVLRRRRARRTSEEPTMAELMAAMVLSNLSGSPVLPYSTYGGLGSRNFEYNSLEGLGQSLPSFQLSTRSHSASSLKQDYDDTMSEIFNSRLNGQRCQEDESDADSGTGLVRSTVSTPNKQEKPIKVEDDCSTLDDEPHDFTMKTLRAQEETEAARKRSEQKEVERISQTLKREKSSSFSYSTTDISIPPTCALGVPNQFPVPYNPLNFLHHSIQSGLVNDVLLRLASTSPSHGLSTEFMRGASLPGHSESKLHRSMRRTAPYHKVNDDSAYSSPLRSGSPSRFTISSAPPSFHRLSNSGSYNASHPLLSPSRPRKITRSPSAPKYPTFSSPPRHNGLGLTLSSDGVALPYLCEPSRTYLQPVPQLSSSWNKEARIPYATSHARHLSPQHDHVVHPKNNHVTSSKSLQLGIGRKVPGDGKKCRKVYGMENKAMWCTACRWKKACQRFPD